MTVDDRLTRAATELRRAAAAAPVPPVPTTVRARAAVEAMALGAVAAVVLVAVVVTAPMWRAWLPDSSDGVVQPAVGPLPAVDATATAAPTPAAEAGAGFPSCDPDLPPGEVPVEFFVTPGELSGPFAGPAPGAPASVMSGQGVVHYLVSGGAVEVRWPPDRPAGAAGGGDWIPIEAGGAGGPVARASLATEVGGPCESIEVSWWGEAPADFANTAAFEQWPGDDAFDRAARTLFTMLTPEGTGDLVVGEVEVSGSPSDPASADVLAAIPPVLPCEGADPPVLSGSGPTSAVQPDPESPFPGPPTEPDPESALGAWLDTAPQELARAGYERIDVSPDLVAFGKPFEDGDGYVTVAVVERRGDGWAVTSWQASGC